jgi:hypothetical protein
MSPLTPITHIMPMSARVDVWTSRLRVARPGRLGVFNEHHLVGAGALPADQAYKRNDERRDRNDDDGAL